MWLDVRSSNDACMVGQLYYNCITSLKFCPTIVRADRGTENGIMASAQYFLCRNHTDSLPGEKAH